MWTLVKYYYTKNIFGFFPKKTELWYNWSRVWLSQLARSSSLCPFKIVHIYKCLFRTLSFRFMISLAISQFFLSCPHNLAIWAKNAKDIMQKIVFLFTNNLSLHAMLNDGLNTKVDILAKLFDMLNSRKAILVYLTCFGGWPIDSPTSVRQPASPSVQLNCLSIDFFYIN